MPDHVERGNATKSKVRARVEHVFAQQKAKMWPFIHTIGIKRAEAKITLANLGYKMNHPIFHKRRNAMTKVCLEIKKIIESLHSARPFHQAQGGRQTPLTIIPRSHAESKLSKRWAPQPADWRLCS
jgi:hypothetical protein